MSESIDLKIKSAVLPEVGSKEWLATVRLFVVAATVWITKPAPHWWQDTEDTYSIGQYDLVAPDAETAKTIGTVKLLNYWRAKYPNATVTLQDAIATEIKRDRFPSSLSTLNP